MNWYKQSQELVEKIEVQRPNLDPITPQQWQEINNRMVAKDYDFRGVEDTKRIYYKLNQSSGGLKGDHTDVLNAVINNKEYIKKIDPKESQKNIQKSIRMFGLTNNLSQAGYVLPNGKLLDFSGQRQGTFSNSRGMDHSEIQQIMPMREFISLGCIRHFPEQPGVDIGKKPTSQQLNIIEQEANSSPSGYTIEIQDPLKGRFYRQYDVGTKGTKIVYDILRFYGLHEGFNKRWYK